MIALKSPVPVSPNKLASIHQYHDSVPTVSTDTSSNMENASETDSNVQSSVSSEAQFHTPTMNGSTPDKTSPKKSSQGNHPELSIRISDTAFLGFRPRSDEDDPPQSVIHAPPGFGEFKPASSPAPAPAPEKRGSPAPKSATAKNSPVEAEKDATKWIWKPNGDPTSTPPLTTTIPPARGGLERPTPQAQTWKESGERPNSLEGIPEGTGHAETEDENRVFPASQTNSDLDALRNALAECWTLCNTLANLSNSHRERLFHGNPRGDKQQMAWQSCWKLCQKLYYSQEDETGSQILPTLDLCRDFCQALFEVRVRENEMSDSVLRVSFELNNHLYNISDRSLPDAFRERTLDFYITLCHRLMKQRMHLAEEADSLLYACWSLAEMLFSIRQNRREGRNPDEELLGSAIQACWELCDLFREGWTQIRPDRGTPRPSQTTFTQAFHQASQTASARTTTDDNTSGQRNPETPTTIFEDSTTASPDEASVPNILVLGHAHGQQQGGSKSSGTGRLSSTASNRSRSSERTSSTHTVTTPSEDPNLRCLKLLITKAALNSGYHRDSNQNLASFAKSLPPDSFGSLPWQMNLLDEYKKLVSSDPAFRVIGPPGRAGALEVARAVSMMVQSGQFTWLRDLYRLVFGFHLDAAARSNVVIQT